MIRQKKNSKYITVDLTGPDGNAFVLIGYAKDWARQLKLEWEPIKEEMTSGDYDNLINTLENYFGKFVVFYK